MAVISCDLFIGIALDLSNCLKKICIITGMVMFPVRTQMAQVTEKHKDVNFNFSYGCQNL